MCACVLLRLKVRPNIPLPSLVFELAYFFPKKNKTLSLGFYSTHKSSRRSRPKNAKFETHARANAPRDRRRPISETDSKKERENNNRATPYKKIDDSETTEEDTLHERSKTNRRHRDFKTFSQRVYFNNGASSPSLSRVSGKRATEGARDARSSGFLRAFYGEKYRAWFERDRLGVADASRAFSRTFSHPAKNNALTSLFALRQRLKNTSMPTQDMERFVELSHREEEEDHHHHQNDDENNKEKWAAPGAMQATNSGGSFETTGNADRRMMEHSKSHPRMLKSTFFGYLLSL